MPQTSNENERHVITFDRDAVVEAAQESALNSLLDFYVSESNGETRIRKVQANAGVQPGVRVEVLVKNHNTCTDDMRDLFHSDDNAFESAREIWADAIELRDKIPEYADPRTPRIEYE